jgi:hypothetical protein
MYMDMSAILHELSGLAASNHSPEVALLQPCSVTGTLNSLIISCHMMHHHCYLMAVAMQITFNTVACTRCDWNVV